MTLSGYFTLKSFFGQQGCRALTYAWLGFLVSETRCIVMQ